MSRGQKARTVENFPRMRVRGKRRRRSKWTPIGATARVGNNIVWTWEAEDE